MTKLIKLLALLIILITISNCGVKGNLEIYETNSKNKN